MRLQRRAWVTKRVYAAAAEAQLACPGMPSVLPAASAAGIQRSPPSIWTRRRPCGRYTTPHTRILGLLRHSAPQRGGPRAAREAQRGSPWRRIEASVRTTGGAHRRAAPRRAEPRYIATYRLPSSYSARARAAQQQQRCTPKHRSDGGDRRATTRSVAASRGAADSGKPKLDRVEGAQTTIEVSLKGVKKPLGVVPIAGDASLTHLREAIKSEHRAAVPAAAIRVRRPSRPGARHAGALLSRRVVQRQDPDHAQGRTASPEER